MEETIEQQIRRLRRSCIVMRIAHYCYNTNLITDYKYDKRERELKRLCNEYPDVATKVEYWDICPSHCVGSSNMNDYPINLVRIAQEIMTNKG